MTEPAAGVSAQGWQATNADATWAIVGAGASTGVGRSYASAMVAVRAGMGCCKRDPIFVDAAFDPVTTARAGYLANELPRDQRMSALLESALSEALQPLAHADNPSVRMWLSVSTRGPGSDSLKASLTQCVHGVLNKRQRLLDLEIDESGHASGARGLAGFGAPAGAADFLILAGVDSYLSGARIRALEGRHQLRTKDQPFGLVPGEAAGALVLASARAVERHRLSTLGYVLSAAYALEPHPAATGAVCLGEGLSAACALATDELFGAGRQVDAMFCDLNGDMDRVDELGFMLGRLAPRFANPAQHTAPANCWGDVGAASTTLLLQLALATPVPDGVESALSLVWTNSGHEPMRGAVMLEVRREDEP
jgi:3-oxoacyl-[acyl-carrier-protein] synthase-1